MCIKTRKTSEVPVLEQATENTHLLVVENGATCRLPAAAVGGNGGGGSEYGKAFTGRGGPFSVNGYVCNEEDRYDVYDFDTLEEWASAHGLTKLDKGCLYADTRSGGLHVLTEIVDDFDGSYDIDFDAWALIAGNAPRNIEFTVKFVGLDGDGDGEDDYAHYAPILGMTWEEFINSDSNRNGFVIHNGMVYTDASHSRVISTGDDPEYADVEGVDPESVIEENATYYALEVN